MLYPQSVSYTPGGFVPYVAEGTPMGATNLYATTTGWVSGLTGGTQEASGYWHGLAGQQNVSVTSPTVVYTAEQIQMLQNHMLDALRYSQANVRPYWTSEPKALETHALTPRDRDELEKDWPF